MSDQANLDLVAEFSARIESGAIAFSFAKGGETLNLSEFSKVLFNYLAGYPDVENNLKSEAGRKFQVPSVPPAPTVDDLRAADYLNGHDFGIESLLSVHFSKSDLSKKNSSLTTERWDDFAS